MVTSSIITVEVSTMAEGMVCITEGAEVATMAMAAWQVAAGGTTATRSTTRLTEARCSTTTP